MKPTVLYTLNTVYASPHVVLGERGYVRALNHPRLGNCDAHTTVILKLDEDGTFETLNTLYKPFVPVDSDQLIDQIPIIPTDERIAA